MIIIRNFKSEKSVLARQILGEPDVSPVLKQGLTSMFDVDHPEAAVRQIITEVRRQGDAALYDYTLRIDGLKLDSLEVTREQIQTACRKADASLVSALKLAAERIRAFHLRQKEHIFKETGGTDTGQLIRPLPRIGAYVPGGTAAYPSTVLMTALPARVAGVNEVILVTPPREEGTIPLATLVAADIAQVDRIFCVGGAQAIAALAFGTESVPKVDKICGPGNIFVTLAKKLVYGVVDIDGLQGPSEVLIIADETANPGYCAADLLAQAEHDPLASAILVTTSPQLAEAVNHEITKQLADLNRREIIAQSLEHSGKIIVVSTIDEALELANLFAPEHLSLQFDGAQSCLDKITSAGCIFIGQNSPVVLGDYVAGPSHVLPTGGTARFSSPLSVTDFIKFTSLVNINTADLPRLGKAAATIARMEGLEAHARAVERRLTT